MAYTQNIDEATPAGSAAANTADDELRAVKRDFKERLESVFEDVDNDPLQMKVVEKTLVIPAFAPANCVVSGLGASTYNEQDTNFSICPNVANIVHRFLYPVYL